MQEQPLAAALVKQRIIHKHRRRGINRAKCHFVAGMTVFALVPTQHIRQLPAGRTESAIRGSLALIDAKPFRNRIVPDMARLDDNEVLAVVGVRAMPIGSHFAAYRSVIEWKRAEVLGQQDDRVTLALIGTERA
ncbi:MAG: hypothetical protein ABSC06_19230 [Rhodopila sp.]|jgi:hypothetical protein